MLWQDQIDKSNKRETYYKWQVQNEVAMVQNSASCSFIKPGIAFDDSDMFEPRNDAGNARHEVAAGV